MLEMLEKQSECLATPIAVSSSFRIFFLLDYKGANNCNSSAPDPRPDNDMCNVDISENKTIGLGSCSCAG